MSPHGVFVTGTDTGIGKTFCSVALLHALSARGLRAVGMKPVASGCESTSVGLRNEDALALLAASRPPPDYALANPYALREPTAPEIAAHRDGVVIDMQSILDAHARLGQGADRVVVEGVGGWLAPLSERWMQADLVRQLRLPVLLVVGIRLGCINHALLSARAIEADRVPLLGWVGNRIDPDMAFADETIAILRARLPQPCLGVLPWAADVRTSAECLIDAAARLG